MTHHPLEAGNRWLRKVAFRRKSALLFVAMVLGGGLGYLSIFVDSLLPVYQNDFDSPAIWKDFLAVIVGGRIGEQRPA